MVEKHFMEGIGKPKSRFENEVQCNEKFLKFVKLRKSWKNHWILDQLLMEKSLNSEIDIVLTN